MRPTTQERFRRDVIQVPPPSEGLPVAPAGMVVVAPAPPDELTDLLAGFRSALQVADQLPALLTIKAGHGKLTRHVRVPRLRMFLRYFLNQHVSRRLTHLKRAFHADAATGRDRSGELAAIDHFEQAVVPVPLRRIVVWFAVSVILSAVFLANVAQALWPEPLTEAGEALRGSVSSVISVDTDGLIKAAGKFDLASGIAAVLVLTLALYIISALPISSFRLKRMLLNLSPTDAQTLASTAALDHVTRAEGIYRDEREAFEALEVPPPREIPFDLIAQATLMLLPLLLGVALMIANLDRLARGFETDSLSTSIALTAVAWVCLVAPLGRLAHLVGIWAMRVRDSEGKPRPDVFGPEELGARGRRLGAFAVDTVLGCIVALFVAVPFSLSGMSEDLSSTLWWFIGVPLAFAAVTIPFMLRDGEHAGQSLGKQLFGLRVVCDDHRGVSKRCTTARELLVKAPFWTGSISLLFLPAIVNGAWTAIDPERRGLQDRAAGTRVIRAARRVS